MPRDVTKVTTVYTFQELEGNAKDTAREFLITSLSEMGVITDDMRTAAATWLRDEGWAEMGELAESENAVSTADLNRLQFSISHSQSDFVAWAATRPVGGWLPEGEVEVTTIMRHYGGGSMGMTVEVDPDYDGSDLHDRIEKLAVEMVDSHRAKVLRLLSDLDMAYYSGDNDEYLTDFAEANGIEFEASGHVYHA